MKPLRAVLRSSALQLVFLFKRNFMILALANDSYRALYQRKMSLAIIYFSCLRKLKVNANTSFTSLSYTLGSCYIAEWLHQSDLPHIELNYVKRH